MRYETKALQPRRNALVVLNAVLLAALAILIIAPKAKAQLDTDAPQRARGDYTIVGGETSSGNSNALYILDTSNRELIAVRWDQSNKRLDGLGYRDLSRDIFAQSDR